MIKTKTDLREYIQADRNRYCLRKPFILGAILHDESYYVCKFLYCLRHLEYYTNNRYGFLNHIAYIYWSLRHRYLEAKYKLKIAPNIVGKGLYVPHLVGGG